MDGMKKYPAILSAFLVSVSVALHAAVCDDFSKADSWRLMKNIPGELAVAPGEMLLRDAPGKPEWAVAVRTFDVDLERDPVFNLKIGSVDRGGEVKLIRGKEKKSVLKFKTSGIYSYDLRKIPGWTGKSRITVCLYVWRGGEAVFESLSFAPEAEKEKGLKLVPSFNACSYYWYGPEQKKLNVRFREQNGEWKNALAPVRGRAEGGYRGSLLELKENEMRGIRGQEIAMIFQDPMTSLNPVMTVGEQIEEVIAVHNSNLRKEEIRERAIAMLKRVGISADRIDEYPHQFSGGMKQRVIIAIALACNPKLLLADEPTTALDVTIQAQVLDMIRKLKTEMNTAMILISHDLGVVAQTCDRVAIIYAGRIVETGNLRDIYKNPKHPYTIGLLDSIPSLTKDAKRLKPIKGLMPDPTDLPPGCPFAPRCNYATAACSELADRGNGHLVRCIMDISGKEEQ